jgi:hypothetical protein
VLSVNLGSGSLPSGAYYVVYAWSNSTGTTFYSAESSILLTGAGTLIVNVPASPPAGATNWKIFIGTSSLGETQQISQGTPFSNYSQATGLSAGAALPASNTSTCSLRFNDELVPSFTKYNVSLKTQSGATVSGFPMFWQLFGGNAGVANVSNGYPLASNAAVYPFPIVSNPNGQSMQSINGPLNLNGFSLINANGTNVSGPTLNGVPYSSMGACYAAIPAATGGTCYVGSGWTETLTANLVISKNNAGFQFMGPAAIMMGNNQVVINQGVAVAYIKGPGVENGNLALAGVKFVYTGNGAAFLAGSTAGPTSGIDLENLTLDLSGAGANAIGFDWVDVNGGCRLAGVMINGASTSQVGIQLDSSGSSFEGDCTFQDDQEAALKTGVLLNGNAQGNVFLNHQVFLCPASSVGFDFEGNTAGNDIVGSNSSGCTIGVKFASTASNNKASLSIGSSTTAASFGSSTSNNTVHDLSTNAPTVIWGGSSNRFWYNGKYLNTGVLCQAGVGATLTGNSADQAIFSCPLPANIVGPGQGLRVRASWAHTVGTVSVTYKMTIASTSYFASGSTGVDNSQNEAFYAELFNNPGVQNAQTFYGQRFLRTANIANIQNNDTTIFAFTPAAVDFTQPQTLTVTFNVANTDQVQGKYFVVEEVVQ